MGAVRRDQPPYAQAPASGGLLRQVARRAGRLPAVGAWRCRRHERGALAIPAQGRGANLDTSRRISRRREPTPPPAPVNLRSTALPSAPFKPAQQQAQRKVVQAQRALPKEPTPDIPRIAHPTPKQTAAALALVHQHQRESGKSPAVYWREQRNDPRQRAYVQTVAHYVVAGQRHAAAAFAPGRRERASVAPPPKDIGLPLLGLATVKVPYSGQLARGLSSALAAATPGLQGNTPETKLARGLVGDVKSIGTFPLVGGYKAAEAAVQGVQGNAQPAKQLASQTAHAFEEGVVGQAVQGNLSGVGRAFQQHPLISALEVEGAASVPGRLAGALARGVGATVTDVGWRGVAARAGSRVRSPIAPTDDAGAARRGLITPRTYSGSLVRKFAQSLADSRREPIRDAKGRVVTVTDRGRTVDVLKATPREQARMLRRMGNHYSAQSAASQRGARDLAARAFAKVPSVKGALHPAKIDQRIPTSAAELARHARTLFTGGTIRTAASFGADLDKRIARVEETLKKPEDYRTKTDLAEAQHGLVVLKAIRRNPAVMKQGERIAKSGVAHAVRLNEGDVPLGKLNVLEQERMQHARLGTYAIDHIEGAGYRKGPNGEPEALRDASGKVLTVKAIEAHARAAGRPPETIAYLPHRLRGEHKGDYYQALRGRRPKGKDAVRTYSLHAKGSTDFSPALVRDELAHKYTQAAVVQSFDKLVGETGLRHPIVEEAKAGKRPSRKEQKILKAGGDFTFKEGTEWADRLREDSNGAHDYVPVRRYATSLSDKAQEEVGAAQSPVAMETAHLNLLRDRMSDDGSGARNVVLVPKTLVNQIEKHLRPAGAVEKIGRFLNGPFRFAVLSQPKWLTGNFIEPHFVRLPLAGSGLVNVVGLGVDITAAAKALKALDRSSDPALKQAGQQLRDLQVQSGLLIGGKGATVRTNYQDFEGSAAGKVMERSHYIRQLPAVKQMADLVLAVPKSFFAVNRWLVENPTQAAALGKSFRRDVAEMQGSWIKSVTLGQKAVEEAARGLVNTPTQLRYMKAQHELLGQYDSYGPTARRFIQSYTPFLPWTLNSIRFLYWTLPAHHTGAFLALAKAGESFLHEWEAEHANTPPGSLRYALKAKDGGWIDLAHYVPQNVAIQATEEGPLTTLAETFLPSSRGILNATQGNDPFGRALTKPGGGTISTGDRETAALEQAAESFIPGVGILRRLQEGGGTGYGTSTVLNPQTKPGTVHQSAANRVLNPFRETYLKAPTGGGAETPAQRHLEERADKAAAAAEASPLRRHLEEEADRRAAR